MNIIANIGVHHAGGLGTDNYASTANLTLAQINQGHKERWPEFPSDIKNPSTGEPYYVGYNIVLFPDGHYVQTRLIGAETAAQVGHNFDTVSICMVGNFEKKSNGLPVDVMPASQIKSLQNLLKGILAQDWVGLGLKYLTGTQFNLAASRIYPHRILQPNHTDCYGTYLPDDWARQLALAAVPTPNNNVKPIVTPEDVADILSIWQKIQLLFMQLQDIFAKHSFGADQDRIAGGVFWGKNIWNKDRDYDQRGCSGNLPASVENYQNNK